MKGKHHSEETKHRISESQKGNTYFKGHCHSEEAKLKISESMKGSTNYKGRHHSEETKHRMSEALKGRPSDRKGIPLSEEHKHRISEAKKGRRSGMKGKHHSEETKRRMSESLKGKPCSEETRRKLRLAAIRRNPTYPNYNPRACKYFDFINRLTNTEGQHALHGGEFLIEKLGYYMDYFNPDLKMIIEWDEPYHYDNNGNLRTRDVRRQREIQELYPDFIFTRVKQYFRNNGYKD